MTLAQSLPDVGMAEPSAPTMSPQEISRKPTDVPAAEMAMVEDILEATRELTTEARTILVGIGDANSHEAHHDIILLNFASGRGSVQATCNAWRARMLWARVYTSNQGVRNRYPNVDKQTKRKWAGWRRNTSHLTDEKFDELEAACLAEGEEMTATTLRPKLEPEKVTPRDIELRFPAKGGTVGEFRERLKQLRSEGLLDDDTPMALGEISVEKLVGCERVILGSCDTHPFTVRHA